MNKLEQKVSPWSDFKHVIYLQLKYHIFIINEKKKKKIKIKARTIQEQQ